ncbi:aminotransferase class I/II-fold pyridoxal phosphate-dependent enzyme, partial [Ruegeria pomeroyi]|nr:aminotransferase class I/II-fold pyridoxal phosphate-dependent enzyme [Ruegeria pomeroyi]
ASFIFPSGYTANDSTISALARPGDTIFGDTANHLSIDLPSSALKALSNGRIDYRKLAPEAILDEELSMVEGNKILITDGVFSMDGTAADLGKIEKSCRATNTFLIVDDAHGVGVLGKNGAGACEYFNIQPDMITGSCAKALGSVGGFAAGSKDAIAFIEGTSTSAIYSTYQNSCALGAISAALDVIAREPERQERLLHNARYLKRQLVEVGAAVTDTVSAIVPVLFDDSDQAWFFSYFLHSNQVYTNAIFPPAVNQPRVRFSVCTNHTTEDLDRVVSVVSEGLELYDRNFRRQGRKFVGDENYP